MRISRERLLKLREKDSKRKFSPELEPPNSRNSKKRKLPKNSRLREWSKNSLPLKLYRRLRPPLLRKLPLKLILPDSRESMSSLEERLRHNSKCSRLSSKWRPNKLLSLRNNEFLKIKPKLINKSNSSKFNRLRLMSKLNKMLLPRLRGKLLRRKLPRKRDLPSKKLLRRKPRSNSKREKRKPRKRLRSKESLKKRKRSKRQ